MRTLRPGTTIHVKYGDRIRHAVVEAVTDQDTITVRLGKNSDPTEFNADREASTTTRGTLFVQVPSDSVAEWIAAEAVLFFDAQYPNGF